MSDVETMWLVVAGALGLAVVLFVGYLIASTARSRPTGGGRHRSPNKKRPHRDAFRTEEPAPEPLKRAAVIVSDASSSLRRELTARSIAAGWDEPLWLEADDVGAAARQGRSALDAAVDVVCVRGDSDIERGVASVLVGTETPVAFLPTPRPAALPTGTASPDTLKPEPQERSDATALAEPPTPVDAMTTALTGQNARVDVGRAHLPPDLPDQPSESRTEPAMRRLGRGRRSAETAEPKRALASLAGEEIVFMHSVVFGDVVSHEEPALSTRTVAQGLVKGTSFTATVKPDDDEAVARPARSVSFSTSETAATSGRIEAYLHASHSIKGWTGVARAMMRKSSRPTPLLVPLHSSGFTVTFDKPVQVTVDGRLVGTCPAGETTISVDPLALVVRR